MCVCEGKTFLIGEIFACEHFHLRLPLSNCITGNFHQFQEAETNLGSHFCGFLLLQQTTHTMTPTMRIQTRSIASTGANAINTTCSTVGGREGVGGRGYGREEG